MKEFKYLVQAIPDPYQTSVALKFGDYKTAIFEGWTSLLRIISEISHQRISLSINMLYDPELTNGIQGRLKLWLNVLTDESFEEKSIDSLILNGPVAEYYEFKKIDISPLLKKDYFKNFKSCAEIIRPLNKIKSYITKYENSNVLSNYLSLKPFQPKLDNDFMKLDRQLSGLNNSVFIIFNISPTGVEREITYLYKYISTLIKINDIEFKEAKTLVDEYRNQSGFKRDELAEEILREHEELANNFRKPHLEFFIRTFSEDIETVRIVSSCIAESAFLEGNYNILFSNEKIIKTIKKNIYLVNHNWQRYENTPQPFIRFPRIASVEELSGIFRMPIGSNVSPRTIRKITDPKIVLSIKDTILLGDDMETGLVPDRNYKDFKSLFNKPSKTTIEHRLPLEILKKHMFVSGVPGSGKTTAIFNILIQLYRLNIPFLVIEPAKTEYRILKLLKHHKNKELKKLGENIQIYSPGNENLSPLRFNPMAFPEGITLDEHINNLMSCFMAAMPMEGPLPALLAEAVEKVYSSKEIPYLEDLIHSMKQIMEEKNYDAEIKGNLETAIAVRLSPLIRRSMGKVFKKTKTPINFDQLMEQPVIIEMDALSQEQANLLTLFLLTNLREKIKTTRRSGEKLKHIIVLEEAHNVVGRIPEGSDTNDPREKAAQYISRMLAELRALGEGIIIVDQLPSTVSDTVIKNTGTKLAHRLTSMDDREELGNTILARESEIEEFARLQVGEAFFYTEGLYRCRRIRCIDSTKFLNLKQPPDDNTLYKEILYEKWFKNNAIMHLEEELKIANSYINDLYERIEKYIEKANEILDLKNKDAINDEIFIDYVSLKREIYEEVDIQNKTKLLSKKIYKLNVEEEFEEMIEYFSKKVVVVFNEFHILTKLLNELYNLKNR